MNGDDMDGFLGGRLRLRQGRGHRAGHDAVLLAEAVSPTQTGLILDVGAGAGAVGLMAAVLAPQARVGLVEIDAASCALARENIESNRLADRVTAHEADIANAGALLAPGGTFIMIHRADALADCLAAVSGRIGGVSVEPLHARPQAPAIRILLCGVKGSKAPLALLPSRLISSMRGRRE